MFPAIRVLSSTPKWKVKDVLNTSKIHLESIHHAEPFTEWTILEDSSILKPSFQLLRSSPCYSTELSERVATQPIAMAPVPNLSHDLLEKKATVHSPSTF